MDKEKIKELFCFKEEELNQGDIVYTPNEVFGSSGKEHNLIEYDERINYSMHFGDGLHFYKLQKNHPQPKPPINNNMKWTKSQVQQFGVFCAILGFLIGLGVTLSIYFINN